MAIFKDKTGRGEVNYTKPIKSETGLIFSAESPNQAVDSGVVTDSQHVDNLVGHVVCQIRATGLAGVEDVSTNNYSLTTTGNITGRMENVTHKKRLKTFEFNGSDTSVSFVPTMSPSKIGGPNTIAFQPKHILPYNATNNDAQHIIISTWVYLTSLPNSGGIGGSSIMEIRNVANNRYALGLYITSTGQLGFRMHDWNSATSTDMMGIQTKKSLGVGVWKHVTVIAHGFSGTGLAPNYFQFNPNGFDESWVTSVRPFFGFGQVIVSIDGQVQELDTVDVTGATPGANFGSSPQDMEGFKMVLGNGFGGFDNSGPTLATNTFFSGRLAEFTYMWFSNDIVYTSSENLALNLFPNEITRAIYSATSQPTSGITGVSERLLLRDLDQNSTHPTVKRSGDQRRLGNHSIKFDDSKAQTLKGSTVQYPTKLVKGDKLIDTIYSGYFNGDLTLTNIPSVESYDTFYRRNDQPAHEPFVESRIYIDSGSNFYQTGTLESVIPGFDAPLSRKSNFSITLPNGQVGVFAPNHSSVSGPLTEMLSGSNGNAVSGSSEQNSAGAIHTQYRPSMFYLDNSVDLFKPLIDEGSDGYGGFKRSSNLAGYTSKSGSAEAQTDRILNDLRCGFAPTWDQGFLIEPADDPGNFIFAGEAIKRNLGGPIDSFGFPQDKKYEADDSFTVKLSDHIQAPFVAEKIVITANVEGTLGFATDIRFTTFDSQPGKWSPGTSTYSSDVPTGTKNLTVSTQRPDSFATAISWDNTNKYHEYLDSNAYPTDTQLDTYTFFMLRQFPSTGSVQNNSVEVFGRRQVQGGNENKVLLFTGSSQAAKQSRELIHFSKIGAGRTTPRSSITQGFKDIHNLLISNLTSSLDAFVDVPFGSIESFSTTISSINAVQSLPITASMRGGFHPNVQALSKNFAFTGSIRIEKPVEAAARSTFNGLFLLPDTPTGILGMSATPRTFANAIVWTGNSAGGTMYNPDDLAGTRAFGPGNISSINPDNNATYKTLLSLTRDTGAINAVTESVTTVFSDVTNAPLVLMPEDKLIMGFQVPTDAMSLFNPLHFSSGVGPILSTYSVSAEGGGTTTARRFNESRIVENKKLKFTDFTITFFGSYVQNSQPQQFQLNQMLSNDIIHEAIGQESISDQFDIEPRGAFTGSYVDEVMSGSSVGPLYTGFNALSHVDGDGSNDATSLARMIGGRSSEKNLGTTGSLRRNVSIISNDKTEFDSFLFDLQNMFKVDLDKQFNDAGLKNTEKVRNYVNDVDFGSLKTDRLLFGNFQTLDGTAVGIHANLPGTPARHIRGSYLMDLFHDVTRVRSRQIGGGNDNFLIVITGSAEPASYAPFFAQNLGTDASSYNPGRFIARGGEQTTSANVFLDSITVSKLIFGLGEGSNNQHVLSDNAVSNEDYQTFSETIRGFRYGLSNIVDRKPRNVFRRDRYGQLRDMLEMSPNTAYIDDNTNTIVRAIEAQFFADDGSIASPEATSCSNLSTFVTSSAPFFDREVVNFEDTEVVRNRGPLNNKVADITIEI